jgi:hypothetical protein
MSTTSMPSSYVTPSKNEAAMINAFINILATLTTSKYHPTLNVMGNECSKAVKAHIKKNKMDIHLIPPHNHHVNAAEEAIAIFKEHFITGLAMVNKDCPLQLWDEFLPQVKLTLNLMRFSANEEVNGFFYFNKNPIAPIGTKSLVMISPLSKPVGPRMAPMRSMSGLRQGITDVYIFTCR